jgi:plasmid stabilization system protein ParE
MFQIYWTEEAEQDLEFILTYYLENASIRVVESVYTRIKEQVENLNNFPEITRPGKVIGTREYVFKRLPYIAIVKIDNDTVVVLNIIHSARKYPPDHKT